MPASCFLILPSIFPITSLTVFPLQPARAFHLPLYSSPTAWKLSSVTVLPSLVYTFVTNGLSVANESTIDAKLIRVSERSGQGGLQVYEFEYKVDSSRGGLKRIFSAAFVSSKKLYLLNITHSDKPESPLDSDTRMMLEEVLHSFNAAATT